MNNMPYVWWYDIVHLLTLHPETIHYFGGRTGNKSWLEGGGVGWHLYHYSCAVGSSTAVRGMPPSPHTHHVPTKNNLRFRWLVNMRRLSPLPYSKGAPCSQPPPPPIIFPLQLLSFPSVINCQCCITCAWIYLCIVSIDHESNSRYCLISAYRQVTW